MEVIKELIESNVAYVAGICDRIRKRLPPWVDRDDLLGPALESLFLLASKHDPEKKNFKALLSKAVPFDLVDESRRILKRYQDLVLVPLDECDPQIDLRDELLDRIERAQQREWVEQNLYRLKSKERIVILGILNQKSQKEIADDLGLDESRISQLRSSAIMKFREALDQPS